MTPESRATHMKKLENVTLCSDAFFPFSDNILRALRSGVKYVCAPRGSVMDAEVVKVADAHGMVVVDSGIRLFHH